MWGLQLGACAVQVQQRQTDPFQLHATCEPQTRDPTAAQLNLNDVQPLSAASDFSLSPSLSSPLLRSVSRFSTRLRHPPPPRSRPLQRAMILRQRRSTRRP